MTRSIAQVAGVFNPLNGDTIESVDRKILIQHLSLPLGSGPLVKNIHGYEPWFEPLDVIEVSYPEKCRVRRNWTGPPDWKETREECHPLLGTHVLAPPFRCFVNITTHVQWYRNRGVVVKLIVVIRDPSFHFEGILRQLCRNVTAVLKQYEMGKTIMTQTLYPISIR